MRQLNVNWELPAKMKTLLKATFILMLLLSTVVGTLLISLADAQPYIHGGVVPSKPDEIPPSISIIYPENQTSLNTNNLTLIFNVNMTAKGEYIAEVTYNARLVKKRQICLPELSISQRF